MHSVMTSIFIVIRDVFFKQFAKMVFVEYDYMVQQLASAAADPALCHAILPRAPIECPYGANAKGFDRANDLLAEDRVAVEDQILGRSLKREGFP